MKVFDAKSSDRVPLFSDAVMASQICSHCGVRNPADATQCRRCSGELAGSGPARSNIILGEKWRLGHALPDNPHVFQGEHIKSGQQVLIKALNESAAMDRSIRSRFMKEAALLQTIQHPNLIRVLDVIDEPTRPGIVMAHPTGQPLSAFLQRRERLPVSISISFALQLLTALDYLHAEGVIHRNLTTRNIHLSKHSETGLPHLIITDFGLAQSVHLAAQVEGSTGTLMGMQVANTLSHLAPTPYTAPELLREESDSRSDLYTLGVILFEMISGRLPLGHGQTDPDALTRAVRDEPPTKIRLLRPEVTLELENTIQRLLSKNPDDRFIDVSETRSALLATTDAAMVRVPMGAFTRGSAEDDPHSRAEETPQRELNLSAFFIDRTPVTVGQYWLYLDATGQTPQENWERHNSREIADQPVVFVTWHEASDYAHWAGKRLPTEAEWEKAARGDDGRIFPWGDDEPDKRLACFKTSGRADVASHPAGASPYGCLDMAGNAFEWVHDWYAKTYYNESPVNDPTGPRDGRKRVLRGGSFVHKAFALRCATRGRYEPDARKANHGFRCVWSFK